VAREMKELKENGCKDLEKALKREGEIKLLIVSTDSRVWRLGLILPNHHCRGERRCVVRVMDCRGRLQPGCGVQPVCTAQMSGRGPAVTTPSTATWYNC
jgi:hypothetical protein